MPKCLRCGTKLPFNVATITKLTEYCDDCESQVDGSQEVSQESSSRIVKGFRIEGPEADNIPMEVLEKSVDELIARGLDPEEGVLFAGRNSDLKDPDSLSSFAMQFAFRDQILSAKSSALSTIHEMMHSGKSRSTLEGAIKLWSEFEAFCLTELLFDKETISKMEKDFGFKITPENMTEKNIEVTLHCDKEH